LKLNKESDILKINNNFFEH